MELRERFPSLELKLDFSKREAEANGVLPLLAGVAYEIRILIPPGYPDEVPALLCSPDEVPKLEVRHNSSSTACLCARCDYRKHWRRGSTLAAFIESLVIPFLTCQHYYDVNGQWPQRGERAHGAPGVLQAYRDFCQSLGEVTNEMIARVIRMLALPGVPKGHHSCPCGSGKRIRDCHQSEIAKMRELISPRDAGADLADLLRK
jgi:hypothetical protein